MSRLAVPFLKACLLRSRVRILLARSAHYLGGRVIFVFPPFRSDEDELEAEVDSLRAKCPKAMGIDC